MTRPIVLALFVSTLCLLVIGGPIASALFESPLAPTPASSAPPSLPPLAASLGWIVLGVLLATDIVLGLARSSRSG